MTASRSALAAGIAALGRLKLILLLTATALLLGSFAAAPLRPALAEHVAGTLAGDHLARNDVELAPADALDFLRAAAPAVHGAFAAARWAALVGLLLQVFFAGGIVETLGRPPSEGAGAFWTGCRRHLAHNLKCLVLFGLAALIVVGGWIALAVAVSHGVFRTAPPHAPGRSAWLWFSAAVALVLFGVLTLLYDFARAARRRLPSVGALRAFGEARRRLRGRRMRGLALLLFWALVAVVSVGLLFAAAWGLRTPTAGAVLVDLVLLAAAVAARSAVRVGSWGSSIALFDAAEPVLARVEALPGPAAAMPLPVAEASETRLGAATPVDSPTGPPSFPAGGEPSPLPPELPTPEAPAEDPPAPRRDPDPLG